MRTPDKTTPPIDQPFFIITAKAAGSSTPLLTSLESTPVSRLPTMLVTSHHIIAMNGSERSVAPSKQAPRIIIFEKFQCQKLR